MNTRPMMVTQQTVRNLALGDKFFVRVTAVSSAGAGPPAVLDQPVHIQETIGKAHPFIFLHRTPTPAPLPGSLSNGGDTEANGQSEQGSPLPHPTLTCTSHLLSPSCLKRTPGSSAARGLWRSKRPFP